MAGWVLSLELMPFTDALSACSDMKRSWNTSLMYRVDWYNIRLSPKLSIAAVMYSPGVSFLVAW